MKAEHAIGETFTYNGVRLKVIEVVEHTCDECFFENKDCCKDGLECRAWKRKDKKTVMFTKAAQFVIKDFILELKQSINIPAYTFQKIEILPLTEQLSVSILVDSEKSYILHSSKPTPQEVAQDLNKQYERYLNTKTEQNTLK